MEETGFKWINPRVLGVIATVVVVGLLGIAVLAGLKSRPGASAPQDATRADTKTIEERPLARPERPAADAPLCATCGSVESVRTFEVTGARPAEGARNSEQPSGPRIVYRVTIRMDDGSYRTISLPVAPGYGVGEKVRIIDGSVVPRG